MSFEEAVVVNLVSLLSETASFTKRKGFFSSQLWEFVSKPGLRVGPASGVGGKWRECVPAWVAVAQIRAERRRDGETGLPQFGGCNSNDPPKHLQLGLWHPLLT